MKKQYFLGLICFVFLLNMALSQASVVCNPSTISVSYLQGQAIPTQTIVCANSDPNNSVTINKVGSYFSTNPSFPTTINAGESNKQIILSFDPNAPVGKNYGIIYFSDSSSQINITIDVQEGQQTGCFIDIFPQILSNVKIQQGDKKTRSIQLSVPSCYTSAVNIQGVSLASDEKPIQLGELSLGLKTPGSSILIPIDLDASNVAVGQYSDTLSFLLYNTSGSRINVPSVSISVLVTSGISPISNFSLSELPTCTISSIEMNLNNTYTLSCSVPNPNIDIRPIIDTKIIKGISVSEPPGQYIYEFKPLTIGTTTIKAEFLYIGAPIGTPFEQEIRVSTSGATPIGGTSLKFVFYPSLSVLVGGQNVTILVLDNKTETIVPGFNLYLNGQLTNNTFSVETNKNYDLRASAIGYVDAIMNFTVNPQKITIILDPNKVSYDAGEEINITTNPENATLLMNEVIIPSNYKFNIEGNFTIIAKKDGFLDGNITISVLGVTSLVVQPDDTEIKKGNEVYFEFSKDVAWEVMFKNGEESETILNGTGKTVSFELEKAGGYWLFADGTPVWNREIKAGWFSWWYILALIVIVVIIIIVIKNRDASEEKSNVGFDLTPKGE